MMSSLLRFAIGLSFVLVVAGDTSIDHAQLTIITVAKIKAEVYSLYWQTDVCDKCSLMFLANITHERNHTKKISTEFPVHLQVQENATSTHPLCSLHEILLEGGIYLLYVNPNGQSAGFAPSNDLNITCNLMLVLRSAPPDNRIPIFVALGILAGMAVLWILAKYLYVHKNLRRYLICFEQEHLVQSDLGEPSNTNVNTPDGNGRANSLGTPDSTHREKPAPKQRLRSLDAFRGFCLVIMMFVNYGGGGYWYFDHSYWNGITVADLVFPWFTFIIGTSIALSFRSLLRKSVSRYQLAVKVTKRTIILFFIGLVLNTGGDSVDLTELRIPGVLQRLAFSYFAVAILQCFFAHASDPHQYTWWAPVRDILDYWGEWVIMAVLLATHLCLTFLLPVDGCPTGYLGPGGLHMNSSYVNCTGGAANYIDRWFFGEKHIYQHPTCKETYHTTVPHEPEGILGTITSIFMCFLGLQMGKILLTYKSWKERVVRWLIWCIICGAIAGPLCGFSKNDGLIPVCKNLWSITFVLSLASMAFLLFTIMYILCDVLQWWSGAPFFYPGMNSILVYILHDVFQGYFPVSWQVANTHASQLAMNMWGPALWTIVAAYFYYRKIFIVI